LETIDLFDSSQWVWGLEYSGTPPGLYLGMHERQLYVQENHKSLLNPNFQYAKYRWQPYPAASKLIIKLFYTHFFLYLQFIFTKLYHIKIYY